MAKIARRSVASNPSSLTSSQTSTSGHLASNNGTQYYGKGSGSGTLSNSNTSSSTGGSIGVVDPLRATNDQFTTRTLPTHGRNVTSDYSTTARPFSPSSSNNSHSYEQHINTNTSYTKVLEAATSAEKIAAANRERIRMEFYATYDVMTGVRIAVTLGGFFGLMVFLIIWKSRSTSNETLKVLKDPKMGALAVACMQEEEEREIQEAIEATGLSIYPDEYENMMYRRQRLLSLGNVSAPPILHRGFRFSSVGGGGYSSLLEPPRRYSYSGGRRRSVASESSRGFSAYPMGSSFGTDDYFVETDDELDNDFENTSTRGGPSRKNTLEVPIPGQESRRSSGMTCCSTESSYLERRCSALGLGLAKPPPSASRRSSTDTWDYYYPDIHIIQPTPKSSPCPSERSIYEKSSKLSTHRSVVEALSNSYFSTDDRSYQRKSSYYDSDSISDYRIDKPSFSINGNRHVFKVKVDHHSYPSQYEDKTQHESSPTSREELINQYKQPSTSNNDDNNESIPRRKVFDPTITSSIFNNGSSSYNISTFNRKTEGIKRAPLASISSFKISSIDYQDSDLRSLGSDSVFVESYADTDDDMEQFSTDSDEISISLGADLSPNQQSTQTKTESQKVEDKPTTKIESNGELTKDKEEIIRNDQTLEALSTSIYEKVLATGSRCRPTLERHRSVSVPISNDKIIPSFKQPNQEHVHKTSPTTDISFKSEPIRPPSSHSNILSPSLLQYTGTYSNSNDNRRFSAKDEIILTSTHLNSGIQKPNISFSYDNNQGVSISYSNASCSKSSDSSKQKQQQIKENDIELKTNDDKYQSKLTSHISNNEHVEVSPVNENRPTIISPSVILELPVISLPSQDDDPPRDPSLPGTSRKWSKETLF